MTERIIDFDDPQVRRRVLDGMAKLAGKWRLTLTRYRPRRSDRQNAYYWPVVVGDWHAWLVEQGHQVTRHQAHEALKQMFLREQIVDETTGELISEYTRSTATLETDEFSAYVEQCRQFLAEFCGLDVPDPDPAWREVAT